MSQPSFYAVIPANVRYDKTIPANAKLLLNSDSFSNNKDKMNALNELFAIKRKLTRYKVVK